MVTRLSLLLRDGGSWLNAALCYTNNLLEVKAIVESFEGSGMLVTQEKGCLETLGLATQLLEIKAHRNKKKSKVNYKTNGTGDSKS